jgi:hypothetical protein
MTDRSSNSIRSPSKKNLAINFFPQIIKPVILPSIVSVRKLDKKKKEGRASSRKTLPRTQSPHMNKIKEKDFHNSLSRQRGQYSHFGKKDIFSLPHAKKRIENMKFLSNLKSTKIKFKKESGIPKGYKLHRSSSKYGGKKYDHLKLSDSLYKKIAR